VLPRVSGGWMVVVVLIASSLLDATGAAIIQATGH
jgi:hypothetical protein